MALAQPPPAPYHPAPPRPAGSPGEGGKLACRAAVPSGVPIPSSSATRLVVLLSISGEAALDSSTENSQFVLSRVKAPGPN